MLPRSLFFYFFTTLLALNCNASVTPEPLTISEAISRGLQYSPELRKAESQLREASSQTGRAKSAIFPVVTGQASTDAHQNATTIINGVVPGSTSANGEDYQLSLQLTQPLYSGGLLTSGLAAAKTAQDIAQQAYYSEKQSESAVLINAFYRLAFGHAKLGAAQSNRELTGDYANVVLRYEKIGRNRKMDHLQALANYSLAKADVAAAEAEVHNANSDLGRLLGVRGEENFEPKYKVNIFKLDPISFDDALVVALTNNPDIKGFRFKTEAVDYARDIDFAADKPNLSIVATGGYQAPDRPTLLDNTSRFYKIGLNLTVPLFAGLGAISKGHVYDERLEQAKRDEQVAMESVKEKLSESFELLRSSETQLLAAREAVEEARDALDLANKDYRLGTASSTDVINLQNTRYNTEKLLLTDQQNYLQALLSLRQTMGIDLEKSYER